MKKLIVFLLLIATCAFGAQPDPRTFIHPNAKQLYPTIKDTSISIMGETFNYPYYFPSLIEHESCISLTHSKCWSPTSRLKTAREEGAGLGQLTKAYRADGTLRFDTLTSLSTKYKTELGLLTWKNVYTRPDLQIKAIVLLYRESYKSLWVVKDPYERLKFADAAYNAPLSSVHKRRTTCGLRTNCDPQKWFGNAETTCGLSSKIIYGTRSACDINNHHVADVFNTRLPKFKKYDMTLE